MDQIELISRGAAETIGLDELKQKIDSGKQLVGYWGTAPTRSPSIGYLIPILKIRVMINAKVYMKILLADLHSFLDKGATWIDRVEDRTAYYRFLIGILLDLVGVQRDMYEFVKGSTDGQLDRKYVMDLLRLLAYVSVSQAKKAGSEVVKQDKDPKLSTLVYPLMQAIDETLLEADVELGGLDQRKIFMLSRDHIEHLGYPKCAYVMNELLPSLGKPGTKMSSSDTNGKIEFLDTKEMIAEKLKKAYCVEKEVKENPCMDLARMIVYPMGKQVLGDYKTYEDLEAAWVEGKIYAGLLKQGLTDAIDAIIAPVREAILSNMLLYNAAFVI